MGRELEFMYNIVIQTQNSETVIHNVQPDDLPFWRSLLDQAVQQGKVLNIEFIELKKKPHQAA